MTLFALGFVIGVIFMLVFGNWFYQRNLNRLDKGKAQWRRRNL